MSEEITAEWLSSRARTTLDFAVNARGEQLRSEGWEVRYHDGGFSQGMYRAQLILTRGLQSTERGVCLG